MRQFLAGLVIGVLIGWALTVTFSRSEPEVAGPSRPEVDVETARIEPSSPPELLPPAWREPDLGEAPGSFAPGTAVLRIGDHYVFGRDGVVAARESGSGDILCQDIRHGASLRCPHGTVTADSPLAATGFPREIEAVAAMVKDAPPDLPGRDAQLLTRGSPDRTGVALIRAGSGKTYKVWLTREEHHPEALRRRVHIAFEEVPVKAGGGVIRLPTASAIENAGPTQKDVKALVKVGSSIPGASFTNYLNGRYTRLSEYPEKLKLTEDRHLLVEEPLRTEVRFSSGGGIYAAAGIAPEGKVVLDSYSAVGVKGDMAGTIDVESYGYVHITGNLTGTVNIESYATVVIDGDILGTLKVRSYTTLLLRGRIIGSLDANGSCWSTFFFENYTSQRELETLPANFGSVTLHLRQSDLPVGKHQKIGTWREVIVGDKMWEKLVR